MHILFQINALLRFLIEMITLIALAFVGFTKYKLPLNLLMGILVPIVIYVIWSICMAPLSPNRVGLLLRVTIEIIIFGLCSYMIITKISLRVGTVYGVIVALNAIMAHIGDGIYDSSL